MSKKLPQQPDLTIEDWHIIRDLLRHHSLERKTDAAYVAYSSAYNQSEQRCQERRAQEEGAAELDAILAKIEKVIGTPL